MVGLQSYLREDVWFWDDATYMARGVLPEIYGEPTWVDSPLYSGMYGMLSLLQPDTISLYLLGRASSAIIYVACVWLAARLVSRRWMAWSVAVVAAMLPVTYIWPGVSAPASGILILAVVLVFRFPQPLGVALAAALIWLAAGSRPEFTWIAAAVSTGAVAWWIGQALNRQGAAMAWRSGVLVTTLAVLPPVLLLLRFPTMFRRSSREWTAFSQHFALRNAQAGQDSWQSADQIAALAFPGADSILGAALINPAAFLTHVLSNAVKLPITLTGHALAVETTGVLQPTLPKAAALTLIIGALVALWNNRNHVLPMLRSGLRLCLRLPLLAATLTLTAIAIGSLLSMLLIYPRPHYLLLPIGLGLVGLAAWLTRVPVRRGQAIVPVGVVALLFSAFAFMGVIGLPERISSPPEYESSLRAVQALESATVVVSGDRPVELFLPGTTYAAEAPSGVTSLGAAFDQLKVDVVQLSFLLPQSSWSQLDGFPEFYADPSVLGFRQVAPGSPIWVR